MRIWIFIPAFTDPHYFPEKNTRICNASPNTPETLPVPDADVLKTSAAAAAVTAAAVAAAVTTAAAVLRVRGGRLRSRPFPSRGDSARPLPGPRTNNMDL